MVSELSVLLDAARWERESMGVVITEVWRENAWKVLTQTISRNLCEVNITSHKDWRLEDGVFMKWWAISGTSGNPGRPSGSAPEVCTVLKKPARLAGTLPTFFPRKSFKVDPAMVCGPVFWPLWMQQEPWKHIDIGSISGMLLAISTSDWWTQGWHLCLVNSSDGWGPYCNCHNDYSNEFSVWIVNAMIRAWVLH